MEPKLVKLAVCTGFALSGWLLPASMPMPKPLQGLSLGGAFIAALVGVSESKKQAIRSRFAHAERSQEFEYLAHELTLKHERRINDLYQALGFGHEDEIEGDYQQVEQPQITGATIHQSVLGGSEQGRSFDINWLFNSNSHHALIAGDTGAGKTVLARWLLTQLGIQDVTVLDPDDDGQTWRGYEVVGSDDDYVAIAGGYLAALEEFKKRKPNDRSLTPKGYVLEELPDHLMECKEAAKPVLSRLLRRGRKRKVFLLAITQIVNEKAIDLPAPLRACFTSFYLQGYAHHALRHFVPGQDKAALAPLLKACARPCLVQFKGGWYVWDVPDLQQPPAPSPTIASTTPQPSPLEHGQESDRERLTRSFNLKPSISPQHHKVIDFVLSQPSCTASTRQVQRACGIGTADQVKALFSELQALELGEVVTEGDRTLFRAYV